LIYATKPIEGVTSFIVSVGVDLLQKEEFEKLSKLSMMIIPRRD
jgi:hypothetical protein